MIYLKKHLKNYPKMQLEDIIKLYLQGILGPAHIVNDYDISYQRTLNEYNNISNINDNKDDLIEKISNKYVRIYLVPYYKKEKDFKLLIEAFIKSSKDKNNKGYYLKKINNLKKKYDNDFINEYLKTNLLISHSNIYKENYNPHYLVINKRYIRAIFSK